MSVISGLAVISVQGTSVGRLVSEEDNSVNDILSKYFTELSDAVEGPKGEPTPISLRQMTLERTKVEEEVDRIPKFSESTSPLMRFFVVFSLWESNVFLAWE